MSTRWSDSLRRLTTLALFLGIIRLAQGAGWSDDFDNGSVTDGDPVTWDQNLFGFFPGNYDASSGDYSLSAPGDLNGNTDPSDEQLVTWVDSVTFTDSYIRTQGVIVPGTLPEEVGGNLAILGRLDTSTVSGYILYLDSGGTLGLQLALGGSAADLVPTVALGELNASSDVILQLDIVGNTLSGYAWRPGDPKPAAPQITATDNTLPAGKAGIGYGEDDDNTIGVYRFAAAQDTPFVDVMTTPGDYNDNGVVDAADYTVWRDNLGSSIALFNDDTAGVGEDDYTRWKDNFSPAAGSGASLMSSAVGVPEPAGSLSLLLGIIGLARIVGGRSRF